jgi:hypothetical protein
MKLLKWLLPVCFFLIMLLAACRSMPSQQPTRLEVTRVETRNQTAKRTWVIIDPHAVQQLFQEIYNLPDHHNNGSDSCAEPTYQYHLNFFANTTSIEKDDLNTYCFTLTTADGHEYDPTDAFNRELAKMLGISTLNF